MLKILCKVTFSIIFIVVTYIQAADVGGYAGSFLRIGTTARSVAMGSGMTADIDRGFAAFYNPSSVAFLNKRNISVFHHFLPLDRYYISSSFAMPLPPTGGLGVAIISAGVEDIDGRDQTGQDIGTFSTAEYAAYFSFANELIEGFSIGVNVKVLRQSFNVDTKAGASGTGIDVGILIRRINNLDIGIMYRDVNSRFAWKSAELDESYTGNYEEYFPKQVSVGLHYHPTFIRIVGDYTYIFTDDQIFAHRVRIGGEYLAYPNLTIRAGLNQLSPAIGVGLKYSLLKRDDAYVDYAVKFGRQGEGFSHIFTYTFTF